MFFSISVMEKKIFKLKHFQDHKSKTFTDTFSENKSIFEIPDIKNRMKLY